MCLLFFFECYGDHRDLHVLTHSFPTRRSSDLAPWHSGVAAKRASRSASMPAIRAGSTARPNTHQPSRASIAARSEEHTSELQSLMRISYAVFCLKKTNVKRHNENKV